MAPNNWRMSFVVVSSIILTVIAGLMLSQLDYLALPYSLPTVQAVANVEEPSATPTNTPLPPSPLPTETATPVPTNTAVFTPTSESGEDEHSTCGQAPSNWVRYVVQSGDTIASLAKKYGLTVPDFAQLNCLQISDVLAEDDIVRVPFSQAVELPCGNAPPWWTRYKVVRGDTLYSLARTRGTTVREIMINNCFSDVRDLRYGKKYLSTTAARDACATVADHDDDTFGNHNGNGRY